MDGEGGVEGVISGSEGGFVSKFLSELTGNPINLVLLGVCGYLLYRILKSRQEDDVHPDPDDSLPPLPKKDMTVAELKKYDGRQEDGRILMAVNGKVFDVTRGKNFYGPDGPYGVFAGRDASRGLATFALTEDVIKDGYDDLSDLSAMEMDSVREWDAQFSMKYDFIGRLIKSQEELASEEKKPSSGGKDEPLKDIKPSTDAGEKGAEKPSVDVKQPSKDAEKKPINEERKPVEAEKKPVDAERKPIDAEKKPSDTGTKTVDAETKEDRKPLEDRKPHDVGQKSNDAETKPSNVEKTPPHAEKKPTRAEQPVKVVEKKSGDEKESSKDAGKSQSSVSEPSKDVSKPHTDANKQPTELVKPSGEPDKPIAYESPVKVEEQPSNDETATRDVLRDTKKSKK